MREILKPEQQLSDMIALASERHKDQYDKAGKPYILHTLSVMFMLQTEDLELMAIAAGHDLIEDTKTTYQELFNMGFSDRVINGIRCMTRLPGESDEEYETKVISNIDSIKVKLKDVRHNSDLNRLKGLTEKDFARMKKYHRMHVNLKQALKDHCD